MDDDLEYRPDDYDEELAQYVDEYGLSVGIALYKEDYDIPLTPSDVDALREFNLSEIENDNSVGFASDDVSIGDDTENEIGVELAELEPDIDTDIYPDVSEVIPDYDPWERDDSLDYSPDSGEQYPITVDYTIYLNDGTEIHGEIDIYHDYTDIEDAIYAANEDIDYDDVAGISYG